MNFWTAVVVIVALGVLADIMKNRYRARHGFMHDNGGPDGRVLAGPDPVVQRELEDLRERVKVLERIVTDERKSANIAAEIESLRDK